MNEQMVPGDYTATGVVNIRSQMKSQSTTNIVGGYSNGLPFTVYQVYDEIDGIVWGRVSSNTGAGKARYVALRVNNNVKAKLEKAFEPEAGDSALVSALKELTAAIREVSDVRLNTK
jgi:hypothetical protein